MTHVHFVDTHPGRDRLAPQLREDRRSPQLEKLLRVLDKTPPSSPEHAAELLREIPLSESDIADWADFGHPFEDSYGRRLVELGDNFELMVMSWRPGDYSAIHDHGATQWGAVRYYDCADHVVFSEHNGRLGVDERMLTNNGDVFPVSNSLIHLMGNPTDRPFLSLHLYGTHAPSASITGGARVFDLFEQRIQRTDGGVFFCLPEEQINAREDCPPATAEAQTLHDELMLKRINAIITSGGGTEELRERRSALIHRCSRSYARVS